ncbi:hypothetical protein WDU94_014341 [Cyamophila willieti]
MNASFTVYFVGKHQNISLDNPSNVHLVIYRRPTITSVVSHSQHWEIKCPKGTPAGGTHINVFGNSLDNVKKPMIYVWYENKQYFGACEVKSSNLMKCRAPTINITNFNGKKLHKIHPEELQYGFNMDPFIGYENMSGYLGYLFKLFPDPIYKPFDNEKGIQNYTSDHLTINGEYLDLASNESDVTVKIGIEDCNVTSIARTQLTCKPPLKQPLNSINDTRGGTHELPNVTVIVGNTLRFNIGKLNYPQIPEPGILTKYTAIRITIIITLFLTSVAFMVAYRCKSTEKTLALKNLENIKKEMEITEQRVATECKETFVELQTDEVDFARDLTMDVIPFLNYKTFAMRTLFPNDEQHRVLRFERPEVLYKETELRLFEELVMNKTFLLHFIRTLESNPEFSMRDRVHVASLLMIALQSNMQYCTDILTTLLEELIVKSTKSHPKLLLRRTECVAEKMLSCWFTFLLYKFLRECVGKPLYHLFCAIKHQVEKGPVDAITGKARNTLSEDQLICNFIDFKPMTLSVSIGRYENIAVNVLDCDTISQVKEKSLDTIYCATPFSQRPIRKEYLDIEWQTGNTGIILHDFDMSSRQEEWERINTLNDYNVPDGAQLKLVPKESNSFSLDVMENNWHLVRQHADTTDKKEGKRSENLLSEIFLPRLVTTKGALQKYVDDLFKAIFTSGEHGSPVPLAIKYMFDFLDNQALKHNLTDPEVVHTWKSNALPFRFWVNLIKNPDFLFDIHKNFNVDPCLSVVAQAFVDSCSTNYHRLGTHSPSSRLIFARDIPGYKEMVNEYYSQIKSMKVSDQDMNEMLAVESRTHQAEFNTNWALHELYTYATKNNEHLTKTLKEDQISQELNLAHMLEQVHCIMRAE